jgi:hypothetical protein
MYSLEVTLKIGTSIYITLNTIAIPIVEIIIRTLLAKVLIKIAIEPKKSMMILVASNNPISMLKTSLNTTPLGLVTALYLPKEKIPNIIIIDKIVVTKITKINQMNLTKIIFHREIDLDMMINSEPSSRPSRKITTLVIAQIIERINVEKLCKSKTVLFHNVVGGNLTMMGTKIKTRNKYNQ